MAKNDKDAGGDLHDLKKWALAAMAAYAIVGLISIVWLTAIGQDAPESIITTVSLAVGGIAGMASGSSK